jgi:serine/threonine-protein kinase
MRVQTPAELLAFLQERGLLTPPQAQQLDGTRGAESADTRALARELVDRNWLTPYQANLLLQGRGEELFLGPYRILDRLGEGGMGQVFKAHHVSMDRVVALKVIAKGRVSEPAAVGRFYREVRAVAKLSHPNIVTAFEVNQAGETPFLAMEYVDGIDLARLVQQSGALPIPQACEYVRQVARGLQHAHEKGLVHRDIKPSNLMVALPHPDEPPLIKILDFGLARFESESDHATRFTQLGKVVGTVDYIAPEQARNARTADIRADIYSLGCTLYYLLTARPPFHGDDTIERIGARVVGDAPSVRKVRPEVSPALERVLVKMTARNPEERYQTPGEVAKALEPHTQDKRKVLSAAPTILDRPVAPLPKPLPMPAAPAQAITPSPQESVFASLQPEGGRKQRRNVSPAAWLGLAGAVALGTVALLGILVGVVVLVANKGTSDSKKGTPSTTFAQRNPNDKQDESKTNHKDAGKETKNGKPIREDGPSDVGDSKPNPDSPKTLTVDLGSGVKMDFVLIPKGKFMMGSPKTEKGNEEQEDQHEVEISKPFYLAKYPVTQQQYQALMKSNPSVYQAGRGVADKVKGEDTKQFPVESVSWSDAQAFCQQMRDIDSQKRIFRLPTEAEWEYACRAGTKTAYFFGDDAKNLGEYAWFKDNSGGRPHEVGTKKPNPWGLYDMHGNVWQWCEDYYDEKYYANSPIKDPLNINKPGFERRVHRGGCWTYDHLRSRAAARDGAVPGGRGPIIGFRVCLPVD